MAVPIEPTGYMEIINQILSFGPLGLVLVMWYFGMMQTRDILKCYQADMAEQRRMYENNVKLVEDYSEVAKQLKEILVLNIQVQTRLVDQIENNTFCPVVREAGPKGA